MTLDEALEGIDEKYNLGRSETAEKIARSMAHLRD